MFLTLFLTALLFWSGALAQDAPLSGLRLAHLSPDAPLVDLVVDDELVLRDVAFSDVTGYLLLPAGGTNSGCSRTVCRRSWRSVWTRLRVPEACRTRRPARAGPRGPWSR